MYVRRSVWRIRMWILGLKGLMQNSTRCKSKSEPNHLVKKKTLLLLPALLKELRSFQKRIKTNGKYC